MTLNSEMDCSLFSQGPVVVFKWRNKKDRPVDFVTDNVRQVLGYAAEDFLSGGMPYARIIHPEDLPAVEADIQQYTAQGIDQFPYLTYRIVDGQGKVRWVLESTAAIRDAGVVTHFLGYVIDITERKQAEEQLQLWGHVVATTSNGIVITGPAHQGYPIISVNPAFERITGYSAEEVVGKNGRFLHSADPNQPELDRLRAALREARECHVVLRNYRKDGSQFWNELFVAPVRDAGGKVTHFIGVQNDISDHKAYEERLEYQANYDDLTRLPNRTLLQDRLKHAIAQARRNGYLVAVMFLDLDRFKMVNDSLGHGAGDVLLQTMAERLKASVRKGDTVARLGGDEFVLVLENLSQENHAAMVAGKVLETMRQPFTLEEQEIFVTCSIGISLFPKDGDDRQTLLKNADIALHRSKEGGRNTIQFYAAEMNVRTLERLTLENHLRRALERRELVLHYQPQVDLSTGRMVGLEALLRWQHPELGIISPAEFIPLAEEIGVIVPLGEWALRQACTQMKTWQDEGLPALPVAVNLSARQFIQAGLTELVGRTLEETGLEARYLELEITESLLMKDMEGAVVTLRALKAMGLGLAIDDFGTGYSSLSYLKRFPLDRLKIDQSFVRDITTDPDDAAIALAVIAMAHSLRLKVIAEGVETEAQLTFLRTRGCDEIQGYYFSPPLPAEEMAALLQTNHTLPLPSAEKVRSSPTLLLVDDEVEVTSSLSRLLHRDGYRILTANSGREGLDLLARYPVEVVVSDQYMPEMNGIEFLKRVRDLYPNTVRVMLSGRSDMNALIDAINESAIYKFLSKPVNDNVLRTTLREAFLLHEMQVR